MARKKKKAKSVEQAPPKVDRHVGVSMKSLLSEVTLEPSKTPAKPPTPPRKPKPAPPKEPPNADPGARPSDSLRGDDRIAFYDAIAGVRPLGATPRARPSTEPRVPPKNDASDRRRAEDDDVRARLAALVGGGVRFEIVRLDEHVRAVRVGTSMRVAEGLTRRGVVADATLDLHGMRASEAEAQVTRFVRAQHRRGARHLRIVHGKGLHSAGGVPVLRDRVEHALSEGGAAPVVLAFATASVENGGSGAVLVKLTS